MVGNYVAPPFERPDRTLEQEFANEMAMTVVGAALSVFGANLWGLGITTDFDSATVDAHLFFGSEPTDLDRYEISEFAFAFDCDTCGGARVRIHRTVMNRGDYAPKRGLLRWIHLERHPTAELPDDVGFDELDY